MSVTSGSKPSRGRRVLWRLVLAAIAVLALASLWAPAGRAWHWWRYFRGVQSHISSVSELSRLAEVAVPASAELVMGQQLKGATPWAAGELRLARSHAHAWMAKLGSQGFRVYRTDETTVGGLAAERGVQSLGWRLDPKAGTLWVAERYVHPDLPTYRPGARESHTYVALVDTNRGMCTAYIYHYAYP
jgi:hypothetical protein